MAQNQRRYMNEREDTAESVESPRLEATRLLSPPRLHSEPIPEAAAVVHVTQSDSGLDRRVRVGFLLVALLFVGCLAVSFSRGHAWTWEQRNLGHGIARRELTPCPSTGGLRNILRMLSSGQPPCTPSGKRASSNATWEVVFQGSVNIREDTDLSSWKMGEKWKCDRVRGQLQEDLWVKLLDARGYMRIEQAGYVLLSPFPEFRLLSAGSTCAGHGLHPLIDVDVCETAAGMLSLVDQSAKLTNSEVESPEGCFLRDEHSLRFSPPSTNIAHTVSMSESPICATVADYRNCEPVTTTLTTTTDQTTVTTTTWGWPSLFCFSVITLTGSDAKLIQVQFAKHLSIFACDEFMVISHGGTLKLNDDLSSIQTNSAGFEAANKDEVGDLQGGQNSQLSITAYQEAWQAVKDDKRYTKHDWIVKIESSAVFFPERLRGLLRATRAPGLNTFLSNCERAAPALEATEDDSLPAQAIPQIPQLLGPVEVLSREAVESYFVSGWRCAAQLPWQGWAEDEYMQKCMTLLGSHTKFEPNILSDERCIASSCFDRTKVGYHQYDFGDVDKYLSCWKQASY